MSICTFLASDYPLPTAAPSQDYPLEINIDTGTVFDGGADDNYFLLPFSSVSVYTDKQYGVCLQWRSTQGRAARILEYIREILNHTETVEFWHVWQMDYWEYEDRPVFHRYTASIRELTPGDLLELDEMEIWNNLGKSRPSFYCLTIHR